MLYAIGSVKDISITSDNSRNFCVCYHLYLLPLYSLEYTFEILMGQNMHLLYLPNWGQIILQNGGLELEFIFLPTAQRGYL